MMNIGFNEADQSFSVYCNPFRKRFHRFQNIFFSYRIVTRAIFRIEFLKFLRKYNKNILM